MTLLPSPQQLRYLVALAESRHFGRAAHACSVTQSTLSAGLLALERQLDTAILDRDAGRHVVFTSLGLELVDRARTALAALAAVTETALAAREPMSGPLRMGVIPTVGPFLLPRLMPALRSAFPRLKLYLREDTTANLADRLNANRLDVLLLEDGHCLRDQALAVCGLLAGDRGGDQDGFAATSLHTLVQMVASGLGITLLPRLAVAAGIIEGTDLVLRPLAGAGSWRTLGLAWRPNAPRSADYRALGSHLVDICRDALQ